MFERFQHRERERRIGRPAHAQPLGNRADAVDAPRRLLDRSDITPQRPSAAAAASAVVMSLSCRVYSGKGRWRSVGAAASSRR